MGAELKNTYTLQRRLYETQRDGVVSTYRPAKKYDGASKSLYGADDVTLEGKERPLINLWEYLAAKLFRRDIKPTDYVERVFATMRGEVVSCPMPTQLLSDTWYERYKTSAESILREVESDFRTQRQVARSEVVVNITCGDMSNEKAIFEAVTDPNINLTDLFRYCLALSVDDEMVRSAAERFWVGAALEYHPRRRQYKKVWGGYIPREFPKEARELYRYIADNM